MRATKRRLTDEEATSKRRELDHDGGTRGSRDVADSGEEETPAQDARLDAEASISLAKVRGAASDALSSLTAKLGMSELGDEQKNSETLESEGQPDAQALMLAASRAAQEAMMAAVRSARSTLEPPVIAADAQVQPPVEAMHVTSLHTRLSLRARNSNCHLSPRTKMPHIMAPTAATMWKTACYLGIVGTATKASRRTHQEGDAFRERIGRSLTITNMHGIDVEECLSDTGCNPCLTWSFQRCVLFQSTVCLSYGSSSVSACGAPSQ